MRSLSKEPSSSHSADPKDTPKRGIHYGWIVMMMGLLTTVGAHGFGRFAYSMINPSMIDGLGLSYTQVGNLAAGNFIGYLVLAIIGGFLAARLGPRIVISLSLALMGITMMLTGRATTYGFALVMRILTGLGNQDNWLLDICANILGGEDAKLPPERSAIAAWSEFLNAPNPFPNREALRSIIRERMAKGFTERKE